MCHVPAGGDASIRLLGYRVEIETAAAFPGDYSRDGSIDILDLALLARAYGWRATVIEPTCEFDSTNNGVVDSFDLVSFVLYYRQELGS